MTTSIHDDALASATLKNMAQRERRRMESEAVLKGYAAVYEAVKDVFGRTEQDLDNEQRVRTRGSTFKREGV